MAIRDKLNENPKLVGGITIVLMVVFGYFLINRLMNRGTAPTAPPETQFYYSDEDGNGLFIDDAKNVPPFNHDGKTVVRAVVLKCMSSKGVAGAPFIQRLEKYDDATKAEIEAKIKSGANPVAIALEYSGKGMLIKRPAAGAEWLKPPGANSPKEEVDVYTALRNPKCDDGVAMPVTIKENALSAKPK